jgi:hypothetical protein
MKDEVTLKEFMAAVPKKAKIIALCVIIILAVVVVVLFVTGRPQAVVQRFSGIELRYFGDGQYEFLQAHNIRIDGYLERDGEMLRFDGLFSISGYSFTVDNYAGMVRFFNGLTGGGQLSYFVVGLWARMPRFEMLGFLIPSDDFSSFIIHVMEPISPERPNTMVTQDRFIVAPATNAQEAIELINYLQTAWGEQFQ